MNNGVKLFAIFLIVVGLACHASSRRPRGHELTTREALALAVELANAECDTRYSATPFDSSSYAIVFEGGRWHWGALDQAGLDGYSAMVSFGRRGEDPHVEVFWSTDAIHAPER